jgi:DNA uptake protein ComE-like DNA-binding protein
MKFRWFDPFKEWFGYTRRERRSSFILLLLVIVIAGARFVIPGSNAAVEMIPLAKEESMSDTLIRKRSDPGMKKHEEKRINRQQNRLIELNACDSASLEALPGIGPVLGARIVKYRNLLGGYFSVAQLREVYGLSEETYNLVSGRLTADSSAIRKIKINSADYKQIIRLPYFEKQEVSEILKYRELKGMIHNMDDLVDNKLIAKEKVRKIGAYLEFD